MIDWTCRSVSESNWMRCCESMRRTLKYGPTGAASAVKSHEASDLDLVLRCPSLEPVPVPLLAGLTEALERSNIPILVQIHDWARLPESFHREIERDYVVLAHG